MVPISSYYLGATPASSISTTTFSRPKSQPAAPSRSPSLPTSPPPPSKDIARNTALSPETRARTTVKEEHHVDPVSDDDERGHETSPTHDSSKAGRPRRRNGTMNRAFKFPPEPSAPPAPTPTVVVANEDTSSPDGIADSSSSTVLPPPIPLKESTNEEVEYADDLEEEVGETEEIDLS